MAAISQKIKMENLKMHSNMTWLNEPPQWSAKGDTIKVKTGKSTDFWRNTFYGFVRDSGHFFSTFASGDFSAQVSISGEYEYLYDQAGLMLRVDEHNWLKAGVEYTDGAMHFSVVITREDYSDWSVIRIDDAARNDLEIRLTRHAEALRVQYRVAEGQWQLARLGYLPMPESVKVGIMCCTPERQGFEVEFKGFKVGAAIPRALHEE
jgi:regulation of enolase protein 1 (concanavalin A-like superfamily)